MRGKTETKICTVYRMDDAGNVSRALEPFVIDDEIREIMAEANRDARARKGKPLRPMSQEDFRQMLGRLSVQAEKLNAKGGRVRKAGRNAAVAAYA